MGAKVLKSIDVAKFFLFHLTIIQNSMKKIIVGNIFATISVNKRNKQITMNKIVIISAPSGSGKSTLIGKLMEIKELKLEFSVSATTRAPRGQEVDGKDYYFLTVDDFQKRIAADQFVEYEQVYEGRYYGTLRSELERIFAKGNNIIFDVDVEGGINLKKKFGDDAISVFIQPPSVEELRRRLIGRGTDSIEEIDKRVAKAAQEMQRAPMFDHVVVNDDLETAFNKFSGIIGGFLK